MRPENKNAGQIYETEMICKTKFCERLAKQKDREKSFI
jgi:hypothetical protein